MQRSTMSRLSVTISPIPTIRVLQFFKLPDRQDKRFMCFSEIVK